MAFVVKFKPAGFTAAKYKETIKQLNAAGAGSPKDRTYHVCYGDNRYGNLFFIVFCFQLLA